MVQVTAKSIQHRCSVPDCFNYGGHRFPRDEALKRKWITAIRRRKYQPNWYPNESNRICRKHFKQSDFIKTNKTGSPLLFYKLKQGTIPSKFSWSQTKVQDSPTKKRETLSTKNKSKSAFLLASKNEVTKSKIEKKPVASSKSSVFLERKSNNENSKKAKAEAFFTKDRSKIERSTKESTESVIAKAKSKSEVSTVKAKTVRRNRNQDIKKWEYPVIRKESLHLEEILGKIEYVFSLQDFNGRELEDKELEEIISSFPPLKPPNQVLPLRPPNRRSGRNIKT